MARLFLCSLVPGGLPEVDALSGDHDETGDDDDGVVEPRHRVTHRLLGDHQVRRRPGHGANKYIQIQIRVFAQDIGHLDSDSNFYESQSMELFYN